LAVSAGEVATESTTLQATADLLVDELQDQPGSGAELALKNLADLPSIATSGFRLTLRFTVRSWLSLRIKRKRGPKLTSHLLTQTEKRGT
jgi:hypothetical protein